MAQLYEIVFDGGSKGNPGKGYGSYVIDLGGVEIHHQEHDYGDNITNNWAEYQTLIRALEWLQNLLGPEAGSTSVIVRGDSLLVINQLLRKWKVKNEGLRPLYTRATQLLDGFGQVNLIWHDRKNTVKRLGH